MGLNLVIPYHREFYGHFDKPTYGFNADGEPLKIIDGDRRVQYAQRRHLTEVFSDSDNPVYSYVVKASYDLGIQTPNIYNLSRKDRFGFGLAMPPAYSVAFMRYAHILFTPKELTALVRHELKHLFQDDSDEKTISHENEYDADWAAMEATDYQTVARMLWKMMTFTRAVRSGNTLSQKELCEKIFQEAECLDAAVLEAMERCSEGFSATHPSVGMRLSSLKNECMPNHSESLVLLLLDRP